MEENQENLEVPIEEEVIQEEVPIDDWKDKYIRLLADFDNYKKRTHKDMEQSYQSAQLDVIGNFLPLLDSFQRAADVTTSEVDGVNEGLKAVERQLQDILAKLGVEKINAVGEPFDPLIHNAIMHEENESVGENIVVEEFAAGYKMKDRVIRHSVVKVAN